MTEPGSSRARGAQTRAVHGAKPGAPGPLSTPIVRSSTFGFPNLAAMLDEQARGPLGSFYQRIGHPTLRACEERLAELEEAEAALLFASGMAAVTAALLANVRSGDHVVALRECYGGTLEALHWGAERLGWSFDLVEAREPNSWEGAMRDGTRLFLVESPTNPTLSVVDLAHAAAVAHRRRVLLLADNTFASPVGQHPLAFGADLVVYSATKSIGGHSDLLAGAVLGPRASLAPVWKVRSIFGAVPDPHTAWLIERSLKTLPLRVECANRTTLELAERLARHPAVIRVLHPGLAGHPGREVAERQMMLGYGPVLAFEVRGGGEAAETVVNGLRLMLNATSLGGVETLVSLPARTSNRLMSPEERALAGISDGLIRVAVGIEDPDDLWADLEQALGRAAVSRA